MRAVDKRNAKIYDIPLYLSGVAASREGVNFNLDEFKLKEMRVAETRSFSERVSADEVPGKWLEFS